MAEPTNTELVHRKICPTYDEAIAECCSKEADLIAWNSFGDQLVELLWPNEADRPEAGYPVQKSPLPLTERQRAILVHITRFRAEHGYAPTTRELMDAVGLKGPHGMLDHLWALRRKGYVEWVDGKARTLRVIKSADGKGVGRG
ncbi:MAG TPA: hypothetical protein VFX59_29845 [Polyangiales bacterium]|nr:hypothetical protein [Polyangiales bacterium]